MRRTVTIKVEKEQTEDVLCNKCGVSCQHPDHLAQTMDPRFRAFHGLIEATVRGGYASPVLWDMTSYTFSLCERCLRDIFDACAIPPLVSDDDDEHLYGPDDARRASGSGRIQ